MTHSVDRAGAANPVPLDERFSRMTLEGALNRYTSLEEARVSRTMDLRRTSAAVSRMEASMTPLRQWFAENRYRHSNPDSGSGLSQKAFESGIKPNRRNRSSWVVAAGAVIVGLGAAAAAAAPPLLVGFVVAGGIVAGRVRNTAIAQKCGVEWEVHEARRQEAAELRENYRKKQAATREVIDAMAPTESAVERVIAMKALERDKDLPSVDDIVRSHDVAFMDEEALLMHFACRAAQARDEALGPAPEPTHPLFPKYAHLAARSELAMVLTCAEADGFDVNPHLLNCLGKAEIGGFHIAEEDQPTWTQYRQQMAAEARWAEQTPGRRPVTVDFGEIS